MLLPASVESVYIKTKDNVNDIRYILLAYTVVQPLELGICLIYATAGLGPGVPWELRGNSCRFIGTSEWRVLLSLADNVAIKLSYYLLIDQRLAMRREFL